MKRGAASEQELGPPVVAWLRERGWDIYQEVAVAGPVADIVATRGALVAVVELKRSFSLDVIAQAHRWARFAHATWIAVPAARGDDGRRLGLDVCADRGIGVLIVGHSNYASDRVDQAKAPALRRKIETRLRDALCPEHKTFAPAGMASGARWTDFQHTCRDLRDLVTARPGVALRDLFAKPNREWNPDATPAERTHNLLRHHYSSDAVARRCLTKLIEQGAIDGLRVVRDAGAVRLYPAEAA